MPRIHGVAVFLLTTLVLAAATTDLHGEEAIGLTGKRFTGRLVNDEGAWTFRTDLAKSIPLGQLAEIRFGPRAIPPPRTPLRMILHLASNQRITGTLRGIDAKHVHFTLSWGKPVSLPRADVWGIAHANNLLPILHEDFESGLSAWEIEGKATRTNDRAFFGKASLMLNGAREAARRTWQPPLRDGAIRLHFFDPPDTAGLAWSCTLSAALTNAPLPSFVVDGQGYGSRNTQRSFGFLSRSPGWHLATFELEAGRVRVYVDDFCLGEGPSGAKGGIDAMRFASDLGTTWIDEVTVARRMPPSGNVPEGTLQDSVLLEFGEQIFGQIVAADAEKVRLEAKAGSRTFPWTKLRGIQFAFKKENGADGRPEIQFRPASGFSVDRLRARLLRWHQDTLVVEHPMLGEIALEKACLDRIRLMDK